MAIRSKKPTEDAGKETGLGTTSNPEVDKKIDAHIAANPRDFDYYTKLVKENPDRAVRLLIWKDQKKHEQDMKLVLRQLPGAKEFYEKQTPEVKAKIDEKLAGVNPYYQDKAFVGEVLREMDRQNRRTLSAGPSTAPALSGG